MLFYLGLLIHTIFFTWIKSIENEQYRNWLSTLIKQSRQKYYNNCFQNNVKSIIKSIKSIIFFKTKYSEFPKIIEKQFEKQRNNYSSNFNYLHL